MKLLGDLPRSGGGGDYGAMRGTTRFAVLAFLLLAPAGALAQGADAPVQLPEIGAKAGGWFQAGSRPSDYSYGVAASPDVPGGGILIIQAKQGADTSLAEFGTLMRNTPADTWRGKRLRFSASLKAEHVGRLQLWLRVDGKSARTLSNMDNKPIRGTADWQRCQIVLDVPQEAVNLAFGFFVGGGRGVAWGKDFTLEPVGTDVPLSSRYGGG